MKIRPGLYLYDRGHKPKHGSRYSFIEVIDVQGELFWRYQNESSAYPVEKGREERFCKGLKRVTTQGT